VHPTTATMDALSIDGRLCILDWGMTLGVPKNLQYSPLEFIAHINVEDYDAIPQDFINLGFSDATPERLQASGITEGLSFGLYLTMLLDTGVLHCDPHKGNLLRTIDGRLCILDWGMTLGVPKDLQYSLLKFIAHINVEDYDTIPQDDGNNITGNNIHMIDM
jgi:predicted unusual protein kinase regulating ubiquinone biosynthesis (AarF/ABC1/UbiB family)